MRSRPWRKLEATGRSGSDEGFDARGWEIVDQTPEPAESETEPLDEAQLLTNDRIWLIRYG